MTSDMIHTARSFFVQRVLPAHETFLNAHEEKVAGECRDTIGGATAAESCLHLVDHVFNDRVLELNALGYAKTRDYRDALTKKSRAFEIVCDVGNVFKHRVITRTDRTLSSLDAIKETCAIVRYKDGNGWYYDVRKILTVDLRSGEQLMLPELLRNSLVLLAGELVELKIIESAPTIRALNPKYVSRSKANMKIHFVGQVGEYFHEQFGRLIYKHRTDSFSHLKLGERFGTASVSCTAEITNSKLKAAS